MKSFDGKLAVVTGGGSGMGRALVLQLAREGCSVAFSDVSDEGIAETLRLASGARVTGHRCDVAREDDWLRFRDELLTQHKAKAVNILVCQAGIGGGGSMFTNSREDWERCYNICWGGVYLGVRTFLPLLKAADEAHIVNTSSAAAFWPSAGPHVSHTAYSASKAAVRGFTEALLTDCRIHAPHIGVSIVMPGHIGTSIAANTPAVLGMKTGRAGKFAAEWFEKNAPLTAAQAAAIILDAVKQNKWRVLVGDDAKLLDEMVRETPEEAYEESFFKRMVEKKIFAGAAPPANAKL